MISVIDVKAKSLAQSERARLALPSLFQPSTTILFRRFARTRKHQRWLRVQNTSQSSRKATIFLSDNPHTHTGLGDDDWNSQETEQTERNETSNQAGQPLGRSRSNEPRTTRARCCCCCCEHLTTAATFWSVSAARTTPTPLEGRHHTSGEKRDERPESEPVFRCLTTNPSPLELPLLRTGRRR